MPRHYHIFAAQTIINATVWTALVVIAAMLVTPLDAAEPTPTAKKADCKKKDPYAWKSLFDGKTLTAAKPTAPKDIKPSKSRKGKPQPKQAHGGWKSVKVGGEGKVHVENGSIVMDGGESITGIVYTGKPPRMNYELALEGRRLDGDDFFATTTFPIGKSYCSLVVGGWGGTVVGLSCVDFYDAGDNITTRFVDLKTKQWYKIRIRVTKTRIEAWIDDKQVVDLLTEGHMFDTRAEVDVCEPLGIASWCTAAALRKIRVRNLKPKEIAAAAKKREDE